MQLQHGDITITGTDKDVNAIINLLKGYGDKYFSRSMGKLVPINEMNFTDKFRALRFKVLTMVTQLESETTSASNAQELLDAISKFHVRLMLDEEGINLLNSLLADE